MAGWRATYAIFAHSGTQGILISSSKTYVQRDLKFFSRKMRGLWGASLPWERRQELSIYLAAPNFAGAERAAIDRVLASLQYHNFRVRRPIVENGELPPSSDAATLQGTYQAASIF